MRSAQHVTQPQASRKLDPEHILKQYLNWHEAEGYSRKTQADYRKNMHALFGYLKTEQDIDDLSQLRVDHLRSWLVWLRNTPSQHGKQRSSKTIESYCRQALAFFRWRTAEEILDQNPIVRLKLPKAEKKQLRVFTDDEIKRMHEACNAGSNGLRPDVRRMLTARNRAILWILLDTGMRAEELCRIRFMDLDRKHGTVYLMGKGAKERKVLLGQRGYHYLTAYIDHWRGEPENLEDHIILNDDGSPLTYMAIYKLFRRMKAACGIVDKRVSPHTCRHWYAVRFLLIGSSIQVSPKRQVLAYVVNRSVEK